ncbi:MAG: GGDEF domain-containing protein [Paracholeplasma sp.]|nr:GGDEF domain-containing protein [Paracholeplasma sp.]MDY3196517.1 GGDEF domain-containing protein [Paracholeplasma sp.]
MAQIEDPDLKRVVESITSYEKMYDLIRMVDPIKKQVLVYENNTWLASEGFCYDVYEEGHICKNCVSIRALNTEKTTIKTQFLKDTLHLVTAVPVTFNGRKIVFELFKDISHSEDFVQEQLKDMKNLVLKTNELLVTDALTGIYNRRFIEERFPVDLALIHEFQEEAYLLMLDLDYFKRVNDQYGHLIGDKVLRETARLMKLVFDNTEVIARYGGEEFIILAKTNLYDIIKRTEVLRVAIEDHAFSFDDKIIYITASIGVYRITTNIPEEAISAVDKLLYKAKNAGRNKILFE